MRYQANFVTRLKVSSNNHLLICVQNSTFSFLAYRVQTRTNMRPFKQMEFGVMRRFSDFLGLHEKLTEKYAKRGRIIPPAPEKSLVRSHISISGAPGTVDITLDR